MTDSLKVKMDAIREVTPRLNLACERANEAIAALEAALKEIGVGVRVRIPVTVHGDDGDPQEAGLAYGRINGQYRIHLVADTPNLDGLPWEEKTAWGSLPRAAKLAMLEHVPALVGAIRDEVVRLAGVAEEATSKIAWADGLVSDLKDERGPEL